MNAAVGAEPDAIFCSFVLEHDNTQTNFAYFFVKTIKKRHPFWVGVEQNCIICIVQVSE